MDETFVLNLADTMVQSMCGGVLGTREIRLLNHSGCGFTKDPQQNTREQINTVRSHPWIAKDIPVRGFVFDMETGLLSEVATQPQQTAA